MMAATKRPSFPWDVEVLLDVVVHCCHPPLKSEPDLCLRNAANLRGLEEFLRSGEANPSSLVVSRFRVRVLGGLCDYYHCENGVALARWVGGKRPEADITNKVRRVGCKLFVGPARGLFQHWRPLLPKSLAKDGTFVTMLQVRDPSGNVVDRVPSARLEGDTDLPYSVWFSFPADSQGVFEAKWMDSAPANTWLRGERQSIAAILPSTLPLLGNSGRGDVWGGCCAARRREQQREGTFFEPL